MSEYATSIESERSVLLVMDYQNGILGRVANMEEIIRRTAGSIAAARRRGVRTGYVRVAFSESDYDSIPATNKAFSALAANRRLREGTPEAAIHDAVAPQPGDIMVRKTRVGAFSTTDLDSQLRSEKIDTLILAGVATSGVVLSTVRDAADRDYRLYVLEDACADVDREVHELLCAKVFPRQAYVISTAELPALMENR